MFNSLVLKECRLIFRSPVFYFFAALFCLVGNWMFFNNLYHYIQNVQRMVTSETIHHAVVETVIFQTFSNLNFLGLLFCPLIAMKSFVDEKRQNTDTLLLSSLLSEWKIVIAKFIAYLIYLIAMMATTFAIVYVSLDKNLVSFHYLAIGYYSLICNFALYLAIGLFTSSLARHAATAAITQIVLIFFFVLISWVGQLISHPIYSDIVSQLGIVSHFQDNLRGFFKLSNVSYYLSFIFLFLLFTKKSLEARNW